MDRIDGISEKALKYVTTHLREHDREEMSVLYPTLSPGYLLRVSTLQSIESWTFLSGDDVVAIGGVSKLNGVVGYCVWLIGSIHMDKVSNQLGLLRDGRKLLAQLVQRYYRLSNYCSADPGQLWAMEKLGFEIKDTEHEGVKMICVS